MPVSGSLVDIRQISTLDMPDEELSVSLELEAKKHGKTITKISEEDKINMKEKAIPIYEKWEKIFSDSLISKVKTYAA